MNEHLLFGLLWAGMTGRLVVFFFGREREYARLLVLLRRGISHPVELIPIISLLWAPGLFLFLLALSYPLFLKWMLSRTSF